MSTHLKTLLSVACRWMPGRLAGLRKQAVMMMQGSRDVDRQTARWEITEV